VPFFEERLQNFPRCSRIQHGFYPVCRQTLAAQAGFGHAGGEPFIHERHVDAEAAFQPPREAPREPAEFVFRAIAMSWQPDHQQHGAPFAHEPADLLKAAASIRGIDGYEGMRNPHGKIANRNAEAAFAEIKGQHGPKGWGSGCAGRAVHAALPSGVACHVRQLGEIIYAQHAHGSGKALLGRQVKDHFRPGAHREPGVLAKLVLELSGGPTRVTEGNQDLRGTFSRRYGLENVF